MAGAIAAAELALRVRRQLALCDLIRYSTNQPQTQAIVANLNLAAVQCPVLPLAGLADEQVPPPSTCRP